MFSFCVNNYIYYQSDYSSIWILSTKDEKSFQNQKDDKKKGGIIEQSIEIVHTNQV